MYPDVVHYVSGRSSEERRLCTMYPAVPLKSAGRALCIRPSCTMYPDVVHYVSGRSSEERRLCTMYPAVLLKSAGRALCIRTFL
ncbi:hypothetical protein NDU88_000756 [Pleurodeles waltl]|uniref:Uncharacterized protein n=1 Tax=Pleurodeles waltl TaxID=8319 RepID=A0AAV7MKL9_PLEWA|nr:hypothetical protein NDU88_000756 [Pleurodeles waltl]